ncbi:hypothetical protein [Amycolatopsis minnesotensis]
MKRFLPADAAARHRARMTENNPMRRLGDSSADPVRPVRRETLATTSEG